MTSFFVDRDYVQTHPPLITSSDCEGAGEVFTVAAGGDGVTNKKEPGQVQRQEDRFFRTPKYLTVSTQLHLEALAQSVGRVWTLSPVFRAERSDTARHLSEFYMLEAEMSFVENLSEVMDLVEDLLRDVARDLQASRIGNELLQARSSCEEGAEMHNDSVTQVDLNRRWQGLVSGPWPRITYSQAVSILEDAVSQKKVTFEFEPSLESGLQAEHERFLAEHVGDSGPVFVTHYPRHQKPFYMAPSSDAGDSNAPQTVACFDLLVPETCELVGGSLREHRLQNLQNAMGFRGLSKPDQTNRARHEVSNMTPLVPQETGDANAATDPQSLQWYLDLRRYGSVPHGGFGLGFDRLLSYLSGASNIRDVVAFPRWYGRCDC